MDPKDKPWPELTLHNAVAVYFDGIRIGGKLIERSSDVVVVENSEETVRIRLDAIVAVGAVRARRNA